MSLKRLLLFLGAAVLLAPSAHGEDYSEARKAAAVAVSAHQNAQALHLLEPLLKTHPQDPSLWTLRGMALDTSEQTKESIDSFDKALSIDKSYLPALKGASQTAYLHGDPRASQYVRRLLAVAPANEVANAMAAAIAYDAKDFAGAIQYFERSGDEVIKNSIALAEFADCLSRQERWSQASQVLARGLQLHPVSVQIKYNLALVEMRDHRSTEAIHVLEPLAGTKDSQLLNLLASAYAQTDRPDDAFRTLGDAILISPTDESNYLDLAILCLEHNQENRSVVAASAGISKIPNAATLYLIRGVAYAQLADYENAEKDFSMAARIDPNQSHSTIAMSMLYSDRNQIDKEKALLAQQLKTTPNDAVANYLMADILLREGAEPGHPQFEEARIDLAKSLAAKPDSAEAQILMGTLCQQENKLPEALDHLNLALKVEPDNRSALDHELMLLRKLHRNSEAAAVGEHLKSLLSNQVQRERAATQVRLNP
jgi:tetratricopeptide (TPR) repeat protein